MRESLAMPGCSDPSSKRTGNLLESTIRCEVKDAAARGAMVMRSRGRIAEDRFIADVTLDMSELELDDPEAEQGKQMIAAMQKVGTVRISASRVGDCPA